MCWLFTVPSLTTECCSLLGTGDWQGTRGMACALAKSFAFPERAQQFCALQAGTGVPEEQ